MNQFRIDSNRLNRHDHPVHCQSRVEVKVPRAAQCDRVRVSRRVRPLLGPDWQYRCRHLWRLVLLGRFAGLLGLYEHVSEEYWRFYSHYGDDKIILKYFFKFLTLTDHRPNTN